MNYFSLIVAGIIGAAVCWLSGKIAYDKPAEFNMTERQQREPTAWEYNANATQWMRIKASIGSGVFHGGWAFALTLGAFMLLDGFGGDGGSLDGNARTGLSRGK